MDSPGGPPPPPPPPFADSGAAKKGGLADELAAKAGKLKSASVTREEREAQATVESAPDIFQGLVSALDNIRRGMGGHNVGSKEGGKAEKNDFALTTDGEDSSWEP